MASVHTNHLSFLILKRLRRYLLWLIVLVAACSTQIKKPVNVPKVVESKIAAETWWGNGSHNDKKLLNLLVNFDSCVDAPYSAGVLIHPRSIRMESWDKKPFRYSVGMSIVPYIVDKYGNVHIIVPNVVRGEHNQYIVCNEKAENNFYRYPHYYSSLLFTPTSIKPENQQLIFQELTNATKSDQLLDLGENLVRLSDTNNLKLGKLLQTIFKGIKFFSINFSIDVKLSIKSARIIKASDAHQQKQDIALSKSAGSCVEFEFLLQKDGKHINTSWPLRVLRQNAPMYYEAEGNKVKTALKFGDVLDSISINDDNQQGRVEVKTTNNLQGWMERQDLLCNLIVLKNDKGLERKAFIKNNNVTASPHYDKDCENSCKQLSSFDMYFVIAETGGENKRYLLAEKSNLLMAPPLVGWVNKDDLILWETQLQVRPKDTINYVSALKNAQRLSIRGGNFWHQFPQHLPVLDEITRNKQQYYHILLSNSNIISSNLRKLAIQSNQQIFNIDIPKSNDLVTEIWLSARDLDNWKNVLLSLSNLNRKQSLNRQKKSFIRIFKQEITNILGEPLVLGVKNRKKPFGEILNKAALPIRINSPLMQYSANDIIRRRMKACEFDLLMTWIKSKYELLQRITADPSLKVDYSLIKFTQCRGISKKGKQIKLMKLKKPQQPLGPDKNYRYEHNFRGETIYLIPEDFLP